VLRESVQASTVSTWVDRPQPYKNPTLTKAPPPPRSTPLSTAIALGFRQGRSVLPQVEAVLAALVWDGWISQAKGNPNFVLCGAA
jgi:hypothetical protein